MARTALETIEYVRDFLLTQGQVSRLDTDDDSRVYYGSAQRKCAIGCLIPQDLYDSDMEKSNIEGILEEHPELEEYVLPTDLDAEDGATLLHKMRHIHDNIAPERWAFNFNQLLKEYSHNNMEPDHVR